MICFSRNNFLISQVMLLLVYTFSTAQQDRPNILFAIADDWGPLHASAYGDPVVQTPTFDRIAQEGILFNHAHVTAASCTPSRTSTLAGQMFWRLGPGSNLYGAFPDSIPIYTEILRDAGYATGSNQKGCAPGCSRPGGQAAGPTVNINDFFDGLSPDEPFCFWLGTSDPHRGYNVGSGAASGLIADDVVLPPFWPDHPQVRGDVLDYYFEVERWDARVGTTLDKIESIGRLENTIIIMTSDHAMPFPRFKSNSYAFSTNVPFAVRWGDSVTAGRVVNDYISFQDIAPTFLEAAGVSIPDVMTGKSFLNVLKSQRNGMIDPARDHIFFGKNSHTGTAPGVQSYLDENGHFYAPQRSILSDDYILVWNLDPEEWPNGPPPAYPDVDTWGLTGGGETKGYMLDNMDDPEMDSMIAMSFLHRPEYEFHNMRTDPWHLQNLAEDPAHAEILRQYKNGLEHFMCDTRDPEALVDTLGNLDCDTVWTGTFTPVEPVKLNIPGPISSLQKIFLTPDRRAGIKVERGQFQISVYSIMGVLEFKTYLDQKFPGNYLPPAGLKPGLKLVLTQPVQ